MKKIDIKEIEKIAQTYFVGASACHDWTHVDRVRNLACLIAKKEGANTYIVEVAALLHDIGRKAEFACKGEDVDGTRFCHAQEGAKETQKILTQLNMNKEVVKQIVHCIVSHRYRNNYKPETLEAKVLFDADKLDSIGAVGIARDFVFVGYFNTIMYTGNEVESIKNGKNLDYTKQDSGVLEYEKKLKHIKDKMFTKTGKAIAKNRHEFMEQFFERFWDEINGKK